MGQILGKARIKEEALPFVNLPCSLIHDFRQSILQVAEGYGLTLEELQQVVRLCLKEYLRVPDVDECSEALFRVFCDDASTAEGKQQPLVDFFEVVSILCLCSGMESNEKIEFLFDLFDFNETSSLNSNELTLAFRAVMSGANKIAAKSSRDHAAKRPCDLNFIDHIAMSAFETLSSKTNDLKLSIALSIDDNKLTREEFFAYVIDCAETKTILDHFNDIQDVMCIEEYKKSSVDLVPLRYNTIPSNLDNYASEGPWRDQIRFLKPPEPNKKAAVPPPTSLSIDWIYGRNIRGSEEVLYGADGSIFYPAGTLVVKLSSDRSEQHYFAQHSGHVTSVDILQCATSGEIVASADVGSKICIWSTSDLTPVITIPSFHQYGIAKLNFSPTGNLLLTLGNKTNYLAVYTWRNGAVVFTTRVTEADVYDCRFLGSDDKMVVCGSTAIHFWTRFGNKHQYIQSTGVFNRLSTREIMTCFEAVDGKVVSGSSSGRLWLWEGRVCLKLLCKLTSPITCLKPLHNDARFALCASTHGGILHLLDNSFQVKSKINADCCSTISRSIDSLFYRSNKLLVGQGNHLFETTTDQQEQSHLMIGQNTLASITIVDDDIVASISKDDGMLAIWDTSNNHEVLEKEFFDSKLSCICYCSVLDQFAIGLASDHEKSLAKKSFFILNRQDLKSEMHSGCNAQRTLSVCQYSNDGRLLAFGSDDGNIYIHLIEKEYPIVAKCRGHTGPISTIDFGSSCDGSSTFLRTNSFATGEAMFWRADGKSQTPMSQRQTKWESQSCALCWTLEAAALELNEMTEHNKVSACCIRPKITNESLSSIFVGDLFGKMRVYKHPVGTPPLSLTYNGHSGSVASILSSTDTMFSASDVDSLVIQWKCIDLKSRIELMASKEGQDATVVDMNEAISQLDDFDFTKKERVQILPTQRLMPWKRSIALPSNDIKNTNENEPPDSRLELERIHGYDGKGRDNLHSISNSENTILYSVGRALVKFNVEKSIQHFYIADGKITCLALNRHKSICAIASHTGSIIIVDLNNMRMKRQMKISEVVTGMDFDSSGKYLAVLDSKLLSVIDCKIQAIVSDKQHFNPNATIKFLECSSIVECGCNFIQMWTFNGGIMTFEEVTYQGIDDESFCCMAVDGSDTLIGCLSGVLLKFTRKLLGKKVKAHSSAVTCISAIEGNVITSSKDRFVKVWNLELRCLLSINTQEIGITANISAVTMHSKSNQVVIVGTEGNEIFSITNKMKDPIISRHFPGGLSVNPSSYGQFASSGDDGLLCFWNIFDGERNTIDLQMPSRACAFSPDGKMMAVGFGKPLKENARIVDGKWIILDLSHKKVIVERRDTRKLINDIQWSRSRIAVGSFDNKIRVYDVTSKTTPVTKVELSLLSVIELKSQATHFDFSSDTMYLRINTEGKQLEFYEAGPGVHIQESSRLKDMKWESEHCIYAWNVQGIWSPCEDGFDVTVCDVHKDSSSLVIGASDGRLRLYRYPCVSNQAHYIEYAAHVGPVDFARWLPGGSHVISTGLEDNTIMIWKHSVSKDLAEADDLPIQHTFSPNTFLDDLCIPSPIDENLHELSHCESDHVELTHVRGYQSMCQGNSAFYDARGEEVIYPVSNLIVCYNRKTNSQRFMPHESEVSSICLSVAKDVVASACGITHPKLRVWDTSTGALITSLQITHQCKVSCLVFSSDSTRLACITVDEKQNHAIFVFATLIGDWTDAFLQYHALAGHQSIYFSVFANHDDSSTAYLVTGGVSHLNFWTENQANLIPSHQSTDDTYISALSLERCNSLVTGTTKGKLVFWTDGQQSKDVQAHNGSVLALCLCPEGLVSAGSDGVVIIRDIKSNILQKVVSYEIKGDPPNSPYSRAICSLDVFTSLNEETSTKVLVGTRSSDIYEISCTTTTTTKVLDNHLFGQIKDTSANNHGEFATVGMEKSIKIWRQGHNVPWLCRERLSVASDLPFLCIDWKDEKILVGCDTQSQTNAPYTFMILDSTDLSVLGRGKASDHSIVAVKISPNGSIFACAASNFKIYVHNFNSKDFELSAVSEMHNGVITALDFSVDSMYLRGISTTFECISYVAETGEAVSIDDVQWSTNTCMHRPRDEDSEYHPTCSQLADEGVLVVGTTTGCIEISRLEGTDTVITECVNAHCGPVAKVILCKDGKTLISIGMHDRSLRIWRIV